MLLHNLETTLFFRNYTIHHISQLMLKGLATEKIVKSEKLTKLRVYNAIISYVYLS